MSTLRGLNLPPGETKDEELEEEQSSAAVTSAHRKSVSLDLNVVQLMDTCRPVGQRPPDVPPRSSAIWTG